MKKLLTLLLAVMMVMGLAVSAQAATPGSAYVPQPNPAPTSVPTNTPTPGSMLVPQKDALPAPTETDDAADGNDDFIPDAYLSVEVKFYDEGWNPTSVVEVGRTYNVELIIYNHHSEDATDVRLFVGNNILHYGGYSTYLYNDLPAPAFDVFDRSGTVRPGYGLVDVVTVDAKDGWAVMTYVKGSAVLVTGKGDENVPLSDADFISRNGAKVGNKTNDGNLPAGCGCCVTIQVEISPYTNLSGSTSTNETPGTALPPQNGPSQAMPSTDDGSDMSQLGFPTTNVTDTEPDVRMMQLEIEMLHRQVTRLQVALIMITTLLAMSIIFIVIARKMWAKTYMSILADAGGTSRCLNDTNGAIESSDEHSGADSTDDGAES